VSIDGPSTDPRTQLPGAITTFVRPADGATIQQWGCNWGANNNQQWYIVS